MVRVVSANHTTAISDAWLAMTDEQRMAELRRGRVDDLSKLPPEMRRWAEAALDDVRSKVEGNPPAPLHVVDRRAHQRPAV